MKTLIVGGTGLTGACTAKYLHEQGHDVTIMSRSQPDAPALAHFNHIAASYFESDISEQMLEGFDWLVFAAGADIRMHPQTESDEAFFTRANSEGVPNFFAKAKAAGIKRAAYLGTYYPQIVPEQIDKSEYVKSRHLADTRIREMSDSSFIVCSVNAPFILGCTEGVVDGHLQALVQYAAGKMEGLAPVAAGGGVVHITPQSLAEALLGALERGESGKAYLVGDQYMSWKEYFEKFCAAAGNAQTLEVSEAEHPILPDMILYAGRNAVVDYTPDNAPLNYSTGQIDQAIIDVVATYQ